MPRQRTVTRLLVSTFVVASLPASVRAQTIPSACGSLVEAQKKEITTPHHSYSTETAAGKDGKVTTGEVISVGGAMYVLYGGKWKRSPMTPQGSLDQMQENLANAKQLACQHVGEEVVAGESASVFRSHNESEDITADAKTWVATGSGLVLRTEEDVDTGGGDKRHISIRYEYTNVRAPAGAQ